MNELKAEHDRAFLHALPMLRMSFAILALIVVQEVGLGQHLSHPVMGSRDDVRKTARPFQSAPATVNVLAAMIQFQPDNDNTTSGNGQFNLAAATDPIIDAPPHNGQYFRNHLTFLENYFPGVSDGKLVVTTTLIDTVYTLSGTMSAYSPQKNESNTKLAQLAREAWEMVDGSNRVADFSSYDCFVIFHAGAGRDIDLVSILGFDPTPQDVPSLYLGPNAFRDAFGADFPGILVNGGQDTIWNSAILPETENRLLPGISGDVLLELSFNGLACASLGSFLGLPDLFDTNTGRSAIGRFGLMDGQAIFSFAGLFPPEPSAWEKIRLGWVKPIEFGTALESVTLPAVGLVPADSILRVPISAGEYFLVENRHRDPLEDGQSVTTSFDGATSSQRFLSDIVGFNAFDVSALSGVVTDVEDFDWSLPGGVDDQDVQLQGGILIWHIDERVIQEQIGTNSVNADPNRRGVDLEEADGSQDIGEDYGFLSPGSGSEEGTPLDFWYEGNSSPVFQNQFSATSFPSTSSNEGANSHITLSGFTSSGPRMSFLAAIGDETISMLAGFPKETAEYLPNPSLTVGRLAALASTSIILTSTGRGIPERQLEGDSVVASGLAGKAFAWNSSGGPSLNASFADGHFIEGANSDGRASIETSVALRDLNGDGIPEVILAQGKTLEGVGSGGIRSTLRAFSPVDVDGDSLAESYFSIDVAHRITTPPAVSDSIIAFGATAGTVYFVRFNGTLIDSVKFLSSDTDSIVGISRSTVVNSFLITGSDGTIVSTARSSSGGVTGGDITTNVGSPTSGPAAIEFLLTPPSIPVSHIAFATRDGILYFTDELFNLLPGFPVATGEPCALPPALGDLDGDGRRDIVLFSGNKIHVFSGIGVHLDHFPISVGSGAPLASAPLLADIDGDGDTDVIGVSESGFVVAFDANGEMAAGFPLQAGSGWQSSAVIDLPSPSLSTVGVGLVVASYGDGSVSAWYTGSIPVNRIAPHPWPQYQKDEQHTSLASEILVSPPPSSEFFPGSRVYNWPNPVYDGMTYIRFFVLQDAAVNVKVFDLAGDLVAELAGNAIGGFDNEIPWDVSSVESGIYFARVEASSTGGTGTAVIKVAVVK